MYHEQKRQNQKEDKNGPKRLNLQCSFAKQLNSDTDRVWICIVHSTLRVVCIVRSAYGCLV